MFSINDLRHNDFSVNRFYFFFFRMFLLSRQTFREVGQQLYSLTSQCKLYKYILTIDFMNRCCCGFFVFADIFEKKKKRFSTSDSRHNELNFNCWFYNRFCELFRRKLLLQGLIQLLRHKRLATKRHVFMF